MSDSVMKRRKEVKPVNVKPGDTIQVPRTYFDGDNVDKYSNYLDRSMRSLRDTVIAVYPGRQIQVRQEIDGTKGIITLSEDVTLVEETTPVDEEPLPIRKAVNVSSHQQVNSDPEQGTGLVGAQTHALLEEIADDHAADPDGSNVNFDIGCIRPAVAKALKKKKERALAKKAQKE